MAEEAQIKSLELWQLDALSDQARDHSFGRRNSQDAETEPEIVQRDRDFLRVMGLTFRMLLVHDLSLEGNRLLQEANNRIEELKKSLAQEEARAKAIEVATGGKDVSTVLLPSGLPMQFIRPNNPAQLNQYEVQGSKDILTLDFSQVKPEDVIRRPDIESKF